MSKVDEIIIIEFDTAPGLELCKRLDALSEQREAFEKLGIATRRLAVVAAGLCVSPQMIRAIRALEEEAGRKLVQLPDEPFIEISAGYMVDIPKAPMQFRARRSKRGQRQIEHQRRRKERV